MMMADDYTPENTLAWDRDLLRYRPVTRIDRDGDKITAVWCCDTPQNRPIRLLPEEVMLVRKSFKPQKLGPSDAP